MNMPSTRMPLIDDDHGMGELLAEEFESVSSNPDT
jgi:hypothetical protein